MADGAKVILDTYILDILDRHVGTRTRPRFKKPFLQYSALRVHAVWKQPR